MTHKSKVFSPSLQPLPLLLLPIMSLELRGEWRLEKVLGELPRARVD